MSSIQDLRQQFYTLIFTFKPTQEVADAVWRVLDEADQAKNEGDQEKFKRYLSRLSHLKAQIDKTAKVAIPPPIKRLKTFAEQKHYIDPACWEIAERENWQVDEPNP